MKLTFLGTGTSVGVPMLRCNCPTCTSTDPRDKRMRTSALVSVAPQGPNILIDCGPDVWHQLLRAGAPPVDAILLTHIHYDHVGGLDDMRPYCVNSATTSFREGIDKVKHRKIPVYCRADVARDIMQRMPYCFAENPYPGVPQFDMHIVSPDAPFKIKGTDVDVLPLPVTHAPDMTIFGYKIANSIAYITDCKVMSPEVVDKIRGIDTLVLNALRPQTHPSHLNLEQAIDLARQIGAQQTFFTHLSHDMPPHEQASQLIPEGMQIAVDNLVIETA